jgi:hypothetical protein
MTSLNALRNMVNTMRGEIADTKRQLKLAYNNKPQNEEEIETLEEKIKEQKNYYYALMMKIQMERQKELNNLQKLQHSDELPYDLYVAHDSGRIIDGNGKKDKMAYARSFKKKGKGSGASTRTVEPIEPIDLLEEIKRHLGFISPDIPEVNIHHIATRLLTVYRGLYPNDRHIAFGKLLAILEELSSPVSIPSAND